MGASTKAYQVKTLAHESSNESRRGEPSPQSCPPASIHHNNHNNPNNHNNKEWNVLKQYTRSGEWGSNIQTAIVFYTTKGNSIKRTNSWNNILDRNKFNLSDKKTLSNEIIKCGWTN